MPLPTPAENPNGLHQRYVIAKVDGTPIDPRAIYFVLRLDEHGKDPLHVEACRAAAAAYSDHILTYCKERPNHLTQLATEIAENLG